MKIERTDWIRGAYEKYVSTFLHEGVLSKSKGINMIPLEEQC